MPRRGREALDKRMRDEEEKHVKKEDGDQEAMRIEVKAVVKERDFEKMMGGKGGKGGKGRRDEDEEEKRFKKEDGDQEAMRIEVKAVVRDRDFMEKRVSEGGKGGKGEGPRQEELGKELDECSSCSSQFSRATCCKTFQTCCSTEELGKAQNECSACSSQFSRATCCKTFQTCCSTDELPVLEGKRERQGAKERMMRQESGKEAVSVDINTFMGERFFKEKNGEKREEGGEGSPEKRFGHEARSQEGRGFKLHAGIHEKDFDGAKWAANRQEGKEHFKREVAGKDAVRVDIKAFNDRRDFREGGKGEKGVGGRFHEGGDKDHEGFEVHAHIKEKEFFGKKGERSIEQGGTEGQAPRDGQKRVFKESENKQRVKVNVKTWRGEKEFGEKRVWKDGKRFGAQRDNQDVEEMEANVAIRDRDFKEKRVERPESHRRLELAESPPVESLEDRMPSDDREEEKRRVKKEDGDQEAMRIEVKAVVRDEEGFMAKGGKGGKGRRDDEEEKRHFKKEDGDQEAMRIEVNAVVRDRDFMEKRVSEGGKGRRDDPRGEEEPEARFKRKRARKRL